jgi:hypothetical protein
MEKDIVEKGFGADDGMSHGDNGGDWWNDGDEGGDWWYDGDKEVGSLNVLLPMDPGERDVPAHRSRNL